MATFRAAPVYIGSLLLDLVVPFPLIYLSFSRSDPSAISAAGPNLIIIVLIQ